MNNNMKKNAEEEKVMHKDLKSVLMTEEEIFQTVTRIAEEINRDYKDKSLFAIVILKGSMFFASDLLKKLDIPVALDFMKVSSYANTASSSGIVNLSLDTLDDLSGLDVLIIEDIIDSGNTLSKIKALLANRNANSVKICTLLDKPDRRVVDITSDYVGKVIPNEFVVGYGLDYAEGYRNLPYIGILDESVYS